ncbi:MAG: endonuclease/exonuclease/phosphatase family protein [Bacteroidales bacterium]|nr:endonuclease/exonuclease/phosphatase family protein [Bacteroidales bacterium]
MKKFIVLVSAVLALWGGTAVCAQQLTLVDLNVRSFQTKIHGTSHQAISENLDEYVKLFKAENPDILTINELETGTSRMGRENMTELATHMNMFAYYIMSYSLDIGYYGNAILSKYPIINSGSTPLKYVHVNGEGSYVLNGSPYVEEYGADRRSVGFADILVPDGKGGSTVIRICCTHLDHVISGTGKKRQVTEEVEFCSLANPPYPTILAGDLNAGYNDTCLSPYYDAGEYIYGHVLDHAFGFPKGKWELIDSKTISPYNEAGDELTDHDAIKVVVKLK